ncbi:MAG: MFS transporter, partial [Sciscionella sp.]|nr:MFS transporter [Sciscionella sp.]
RRGWYAYGWASHTFEATVVAVFAGRYITAVGDNAVGDNGRLHVLGIPIAPGSLYTYTVSLGSLLLFVVLPIVGAVADRTGHKRAMMLGFGYAGAACCTAMIFVGITDWQLGAGLFLLGYLTYSAAKIVFNSILPVLAGPDERDRVSSIGWGIAYAGGGVLLALNFVSSFGLITDKAWLARISLCSAGVWWALFMLIPLVRLRGLPRPADARKPIGGSVLSAGFRELGNTLRSMRAFPLTLLFLAAYLIYYDGISTLTTLAAVYADAELHLGETILLATILVVQFAGFGGALLLGRLANIWGAKRTVIGSLVVWIGVAVAAYFLQAGNSLEFIVLALVLSIVLGGTQALSRSLFSGMIPNGKEAEFFSFYEVSSSGTSFFGPLLFGLTLQLTGSYRSAIVSLIVFFVVGLALLIPVDAAKAIRAAGNTPPATLR